MLINYLVIGLIIAPFYVIFYKFMNKKYLNSKLVKETLGEDYGKAFKTPLILELLAILMSIILWPLTVIGFITAPFYYPVLKRFYDMT